MWDWKELMDTVMPSVLDTEPMVIRINFLVSAVFFVFIWAFVGVIIFYRFKKNYVRRKEQRIEELIGEFLNNNIFDAYMPEDRIRQFQANYLHGNFGKKIALKQFLVFAENFKGESVSMLKKLFFTLSLDKFVFKSLQKGSWYHKTRSLYVLSELGITNDEAVRAFLQSRHQELREQAILYFIRTSKENPLAFLNLSKQELNLWEQIYIEDSLRYFYTGIEPDFAQWLNHELSSVAIFAMKMIHVFNQYENIPKLLPLVKHPNAAIRKNCIIALKKLNYENLPALLKEDFSREEPSVQKEIVRVFGVLGSYEEFLSLEERLGESSPEIAILYKKTLFSLKQAD